MHVCRYVCMYINKCMLRHHWIDHQVVYWCQPTHKCTRFYCTRVLRLNDRKTLSQLSYCVHIHMCEWKVRSCKQKIICTYILHSTVSSWLQKGHRNFVDKNTFFFVTTFFCFLRLRPMFSSVRYSITTIKKFKK